MHVARGARPVSKFGFGSNDVRHSAKSSSSSKRIELHLVQLGLVLYGGGGDLKVTSIAEEHSELGTVRLGPPCQELTAPPPGSAYHPGNLRIDHFT